MNKLCDVLDSNRNLKELKIVIDYSENITNNSLLNLCKSLKNLTELKKLYFCLGFNANANDAFIDDFFTSLKCINEKCLT